MPPGSRSSSDIPSSPSSLRRDVDELKLTKSNKETTDLKFGEVDKDIIETKKIALSAKKTAESTHPCHQEERMKSVEGKSSGWNKFFRGLVITMVVGGFVAGGYFVKIELTKADKSEVEAVKKDVTTIKSDVSAVKDSQQRMEQQMAPDAQLELEEKKLELMKKMMKEALVEAKADIKPNRGGRRTN